MPSDAERDAARALIQRIENASSDGFFPCEADVDEAVEFALEAFAAIRAECEAAHAERIKALEKELTPIYEANKQRDAAQFVAKHAFEELQKVSEARTAAEARLAAAKAEGRAEMREEAARAAATIARCYHPHDDDSEASKAAKTIAGAVEVAIRNFPASPAPASEETQG